MESLQGLGFDIYEATKLSCLKDLHAHQEALGAASRKKRKENYVGRGNSLYINLGKGDALEKSRESPPQQSYKTESANGDLEGYWKHPAPGPGCDKYCCMQ
eukprot:1075720-Pelagomonas_calceolata.AAC.1